MEALKAVSRDIYGGLDDGQEHFVIIALDSRREMLGYKVIASGGRASVEVEPRVLFVSALLLGAKREQEISHGASGSPAGISD